MSCIYIVDTSTFIDLKKFPEDVFPTLWRCLAQLVADGRLIAPHEVFRELEAGDDEITAWARAHRAMVVDLDEATAACIQELMGTFERLRDPEWQGPHCADPVVVALYLAKSRADVDTEYVVVTQERLRGPGSVQIPNLCQPFNHVPIKLMDVFRRENLRF